MRREQWIAVGALIFVVAFAAYTVATRYHDGRCGGHGRRGGLDCSYAPGTFPTHP